MPHAGADALFIVLKFLLKPQQVSCQSTTYSNYKKHNTVKFLITITPCGTISILSDCWGGHVSDKTLTQESGVLNLFEPGNTVLANNGFIIVEDVILHGANLEIPGKQQLSQEDVELFAFMLKDVLKNKYTILKGTLPYV